MANISKPYEARIALEQDFSDETVREVLFYLIDRDEKTRQGFNRVQAVFTATLTIEQELMATLTKIASTGAPLSREDMQTYKAGLDMISQQLATAYQELVLFRPEVG